MIKMGRMIEVDHSVFKGQFDLEYKESCKSYIRCHNL